MPAEDSKFLVVFSDGEDLNSAASPTIIGNAAEGIENFEVFCIDHMPGPKLNRFLTSASLVEGRAENQRVEIYSDSPELLDVIKSTYVQAICNTEEIRISPQIQSGYGIDKWSLHLTGAGKPIGSLEGRALNRTVTVTLEYETE